MERGAPESETFGFLKGAASSSDSMAYTVPFFNAFFETPEENSTAFMDSIATLLDTAKSENLGRLTLIIPPANTTVFAWLTHESGYLQSFVYPSFRESDTSYIDLGMQLPGKYTFFGFY
jgi:hypothetical protein